jgi:hypothetical protein
VQQENQRQPLYVHHLQRKIQVRVELISIQICHINKTGPKQGETE